MINKLSLSLVVAGVLLASCSSSDDNSNPLLGIDDPGTGTQAPQVGETDPPAGDGDEAPGAPASDTAPSDAELQQSDGVVSVDQAFDLAAGRWRSMNDATQCTTTYTFGQDRAFTLTGLDQVASGNYNFDEDAGFEAGGGLSIVFDFERDNFGSDCFGQSENTLQPVVSYSQYVNFPDRNTLILSTGPNISERVMEFDRQ